jgi:hypothetical protein
MERGMKCPRCDDVGAVVVKQKFENGGSITTHLCPCRQGAEPRKGRARWWSIRTASQRVWQSCTGLSAVGIEVTVEVPISEDNWPLIRDAENAYYPAMACIDADLESLMLAEDLRSLAEALVQTADELDALEASVVAA